MYDINCNNRSNRYLNLKLPSNKWSHSPEMTPFTTSSTPAADQSANVIFTTSSFRVSLGIKVIKSGPINSSRSPSLLSKSQSILKTAVIRRNFLLTPPPPIDPGSTSSQWPTEERGQEQSQDNKLPFNTQQQEQVNSGAEKSRSRIMGKWIGQLEKCRQDDSLLLYFFDKTNVDFPNWHATSHHHHLSPGFASVWSSRRLLNGRCPCCSHCPGGLLFFFSSLLVVHLNQSMFRFRHSWIEINRIKQQTKYETSSDQSHHLSAPICLSWLPLFTWTASTKKGGDHSTRNSDTALQWQPLHFRNRILFHYYLWH